MSKIRKTTEDIRHFIIKQVGRNGANLSAIVANKFDISRQSASRHIRELVNNETLIAKGSGRGRVYELAQKEITTIKHPLNNGVDEYIIWLDDIKPNLDGLPDNVMDIWHYGVSEMINNAKDHSDGDMLTIQITRNALETTLIISDNGIGIFKKLQQALGLSDQRQAVLELAKGKITTDPKNHSGEGIFFTSRMFDNFWIISNDIAFSHQHGKPEDWIMELQQPSDSTFIIMELSNHTARTEKEVFDEYSKPDEYAFSKTVVPLRMASFGDDKLISRSQAKRVVSNLDKFHTILLDFDCVEGIGQGFADEIFRVYQDNNPDMELIPINANTDIMQMITRVIATARLNNS